MYVVLVIWIRDKFHEFHYCTLQVYQRSYSQVGHIPLKMSDKFESQHSLSPTIWSDIVVGRESAYLKIFFYISRGEHVKHFVIDAYL
jgi:phosphatidylserine/phosphatidylglycerophosphate/cardiolipin synthase-like enzyme